MVIKRELARVGDRHLIEIQFVGISGQVCSTSYELDGLEPLFFTDRAEAEAALRIVPAATAAAALHCP